MESWPVGIEISGIVLGTEIARAGGVARDAAWRASAARF
jgi:hypothetical protein